MFKNKKILITGATGFIGANLTRYFLKRGADVAIFTRKTSNKWRIKDILPHIREYNVDLFNSDGLNRIMQKIKPQIIFHTAVYGGYPFQVESEKMLAVNFYGTVNLINTCKNINYELFVNTGSSSEYGGKLHSMKENDMLEPITDYGVSKAAATLYVHAVAKRQNLPVVTLRLFSPYGYYEEPTRLIPSVIISCLKGKSPKLSSPDCVRDFIFIEDVLEFYARVVKNKDKIKGEIFNLGSGEECSVGNIVTRIIKLTGNKTRPEWGSIKNRRYEPPRWRADIAKAKKLLNWQPQYDVSYGLEKTVDWFKKNISLYENELE